MAMRETKRMERACDLCHKTGLDPADMVVGHSDSVDLCFDCKCRVLQEIRVQTADLIITYVRKANEQPAEG